MSSSTYRYVSLLARWRRAIVVLAGLVAVAAVFISLRLRLRADLAQLLPEHDAALVQLSAIERRVGAPSTLIVAIEGPEPTQNRRFADLVAAALQPLIGHGLRAVDARREVAQGFFEHNRALYASVADLERVDNDLEGLLLEAKNPAYVALDDPRHDLEELSKRAAKATPKSAYIEGENGRLVAVVGWAEASGSGDDAGNDLLQRVGRIVAQAQPRAHGVVARLTGDVVVSRAEHDALEQDIELVSVICTLLVLGVIVAFFRSALAVPVVFIPTLIAVVVACAVTTLAIGYVNTNTAFLGSIIVGNGINFGIILLARFLEERRGRLSVVEALARAVAGTARPTLVAALAASIAYGSLALTRFRGFQQFGLIGGVAMTLCWLLTYGLVPVLVMFVGERWPLPRAPTARLHAATARLLSRPGGAAVITMSLTLAAVAALWPVARNPFEYDFRKLRNQRSAESGAGRLYSRVGKLFPSDNLQPIAVALVEHADAANEYRRELLARDAREGGPDGRLLDDVAVVQRLLPEQQMEKLALLQRIDRRLADPAFKLLSPEEQRDLNRWRPPTDLRPLTVADLPEALLRPFRERDGTLGRVALIFPVQRFQGWDGHQLLRFDERTRPLALASGETVAAAGLASVFAAMMRYIVPDGTRAAGAALLGVTLLVIVLVRRPRGVLLVLASLGLGSLAMAGAGAALGLRLNFLNFVALPVTLGIGVDYAVNIWMRLFASRREAHASALLQTGSAVALCSATTIIGYGSLLLADNGALRSFGALAALGEAGCLGAALLVLPLWMRQRSDS